MINFQHNFDCFGEGKDNVLYCKCKVIYANLAWRLVKTEKFQFPEIWKESQ